MAGTYIKLFRKAVENDLFNEKPFDRWHAFEYLLIRACRFEKTVVIKGQAIHLKPGQLIIGQRKIAATFGWSRGKLARFWELLEDLKMATFDGATYGASIGTLVTIENYEKYQGEEDVCETTDESTNRAMGSTTNRAIDGANIKKDKKDKKVKNNIFKPPTVQQVEEYCQERGNGVDAERFIDFYESKGWMVGKNKMKDWKAAVRNWERNRASKSVQPKESERLGWIDEI